MLTYIKSNYKLLLIFGCIMGAIATSVFSKPDVTIPNTDEIVKIQTKAKEEAIAKANEFEKQAASLKLSSEQDKARLKAEIRRPKASLPASSTTAIAPETLQACQDALTAANEARLIQIQIVEKQDSQIAMLESDNATLTKQNLLINSANAQLRIALTESQKNESIMRISKDAQIAAIKSAKWRGRYEGFSVAALADITLRLAKVM